MKCYVYWELDGNEVSSVTLLSVYGEVIADVYKKYSSELFVYFIKMTAYVWEMSFQLYQTIEEAKTACEQRLAVLGWEKISSERAEKLSVML